MILGSPANLLSSFKAVLFFRPIDEYVFSGQNLLILFFMAIHQWSVFRANLWRRRYALLLFWWCDIGCEPPESGQRLWVYSGSLRTSVRLWLQSCGRLLTPWLSRCTSELCRKNRNTRKIQIEEERETHKHNHKIDRKNRIVGDWPKNKVIEDGPKNKIVGDWP